MAEPRATGGGDAVCSAVAKMQQARRIQNKWAQKNDDIENELKKLETRRRELEMMRLMTRGQYNDWEKDSFQRTFVPYSRACNMQLADRMQSKLPRELRDMVYAHLWDEHSLICRYSGSPVRLVAGGLLDLDVAGLTAMCDASVLPHFLGLEYVGQATALEMVLALYKALRGHDAVRASTQHLHRAFLEDQFHVGFQAYPSLRELSVYCKLDRYRTPALRHKLTKSCKHSGLDTLYINQARLNADLKAFDLIKDKKNFKLEILLLQRNIRVAVLKESLVAIRDVRAKLIEEGADVRINWSYDGDNDIVYGGGNPMVFTAIDGYFDMSHSKWEKQFKNFIAAHRGHILGSHYRIDHERSVTGRSVNELAHSRWCDSESEKSWNEEDTEDDSEEDSDLDSDADMY